MEQPIPWLNRASFEGRISLPSGFDLNVFTPYLTDLVETVLPRLMGKERLTTLIAWTRLYPYGVIEEPGEPDVLTREFFQLVEAYLVYSVYAEYVMKGDVQNTDVGIVRKALDSSEAISDAQRTQLYRNYQAMASERARMIADFVAADRDSCTAPVVSSGPRFSSSRGRTKSVFD